MFRFENNLPKCFVDESRDFQLMTRLDDSIFMGQRADIATMTNLNASKKCKNTFLDLLAKKVGFFTNEYLDDDILRAIIGAFQSTIKYKGTKKGIEMAVKTILKCENSVEEPVIEIVTGLDPVTGLDHYVQILTPIDLQNKIALREFLKYILPFGYVYMLRVYKKIDGETLTKVNQLNTVNVYKSSNYNLGTIRTYGDIDNEDNYVISPDINYNNNEDNNESEVNHLLGTYDLGLIVSNDDLDGSDSNTAGTGEKPNYSNGTLDFIDYQESSNSITKLDVDTE